MYKAYIITFDTEGLLDPFDYNAFNNKLITAKGIVDWWHHLKSTYIVIVDWNIEAKGVSDFIMKIAPNKHFFVAEINLKNHNGWLPKQAWDWINKYKGQIL